MFRFPDINKNLIAFVYAGDIWTVNSEGGEARRITSHIGLELFPKISPDGKWIAFSAEYSGNRQVYIVSTDGGQSKQLTFYNDIGPMPPRGGFDYVVLDWTKDGKNILIRANRTPYGKRIGKYFLLSINGGPATPLEIPEGGFGCFSPDNNLICYAPVSREFRTWKRYKGGRAADLWIYNLKKHISERITDLSGTEQIPVWYKDKIFFASDRDLTLNIFSYDVKTKKITKITNHKNYDVMWPSGKGGQLVYENGGKIYKLDLNSLKTKQVPVKVDYDNPNLHSYIKNVKSDIYSYNISPTGKRALLGARGDIFSVPAKNGIIYNLTKTQGVREIYPAWSPDGKWIVYYSDNTGEYQIYLQDAKMRKQPVQLTNSLKAWLFPPIWSPNGKTIVFADKTQSLKSIDVNSGKITVLDKATFREFYDYSFSKDSKWLTYTKQCDNGQSSVFVYSFEKGKSFKVTDETFNDYNPVFSDDGDYIFFLSDRDFNLTFSSFEFDYLYNKATRVYAVALRKSVKPLFPFKNDCEFTKKEDNSKGKRELKAENKSIVIDFEGIASRIIALPMKAGNYYSLYPVKEGLLFADSKGVHKFNLKTGKDSVVLKDVRQFVVSYDNKKILYHFGSEYGITELTGGKKAGDGKLNLKNLTMKIEPQKEWAQIFEDARRIYRDWFYVKNLHNVDWKSVCDKYRKLLPDLGHRADLDYILGELVGESNTGHSYVNYGDFPKVKRIENGLLGAEFVRDNKAGFYKITKIFKGENWNKFRRSPLTEQGVDIKEGDYILKINGEVVKANDNIYKFLENTANKTITVTVNSKPVFEGSNTYFVKPIKHEQELFYLNWVNERRKMVDRLSNGRIGYIHVPNTAVEGNRELFKGMYAYADKDALIIDDRYNGGGFIPDVMVELLGRKTLSYWARAGLKADKTPAVAHDGPKVMLINHYSSSGGDAFPYYFKKLKLGTLIGTRTWGGLVGISGNASFVDGGSLHVPTFGFFNTEGKWDVEGVGVSPDIEVEDVPHLVAKGHDPALEKAVELLMEKLKEKGNTKVKQPKDPDRKGFIKE
jgi:tricorn protease